MNHSFSVMLDSGLFRNFRWFGHVTLAALFLVPLSAHPLHAEGIASVDDLAALPSVQEVPFLSLGVGDAVSLQVYGRPEMQITTYVSDDGSITVPLAGKVSVLGLSPAEAGERVSDALREGGFILDPQVTLLITQFRSRQISILGAVRSPGRFVVESDASLMDALALAGGISDSGGQTVLVLRTGGDGETKRIAVDLGSIESGSVALPSLALQNGDAVFVPVSEQFYVYGEVNAPNMYRLEPGMTVIQALARSGGLTPRGSSRRIEIRRPRADGSYGVQAADLADLIQADDVIRVKERIF
ncbi:SLBB domain-containing protein [Pseudomarimonas salicorniae]|uniref:SLBB domain-containing protein n=1 Tax=Pseudomarimonas salicorniae TaxID=2933270 RepID=A0ABT0GFE6_9GAMM|nr:SLBB domain-containing protein [Lysobacter sp. CAU 1642]MCK7593087.1 SLBB domain-containing protein [Lysobacter sp. CAU 1642]